MRTLVIAKKITAKTTKHTIQTAIANG